MKYYVLIVLNLSGVTENERKCFNDVLFNKKWKKIEHFDSIWSVEKDTDPKNISNEIEDDLKDAVIKIPIGKLTLSYAMQYSNTKVFLNKIQHKSIINQMIDKVVNEILDVDKEN